MQIQKPHRYVGKGILLYGLLRSICILPSLFKNYSMWKQYTTLRGKFMDSE